MQIKVPNYHNQLKFDNTVFDSIDTEEKAYWLGFLYADGNVGNSNNIINLTLSSKDKEHLQKFNKFLKNKKPIYESITKIRGKEYSICRVCVCNKHLKEVLTSLGCIPRKSLTLNFPPLHIFKDENLVYDFIRGYVDGDGCITFSRGGRMALNILGTYDFLDGIRKVFVDKFSNIHKIKRLQSNVWCLSNCGENADAVTKKLYENATIYLQRKYNRFVVLNRNI